MEGCDEPAAKDWLGKLPDGVVLLVCEKLPPGPVGRGDFRSLCRGTRPLANSMVTKARVQDWNQAAQMGSSFPRLEELIVEYSSLAEMDGALAFLQRSASQLTRLRSLEVQRGEVSQVLMEQLCSSMPRLQRLRLPKVQRPLPPPDLALALVQQLCGGTPELVQLLPRLRQLQLRERPGGDDPFLQLRELPLAPRPVLDVVRCITQLGHLTELEFKALDAPPEAVALLSRLPNLLALDLSDGDLQDEHLAALAGLSELKVLRLLYHWRITAAGLLALLSRLPMLTSLKLFIPNSLASKAAYAVLSQLSGLQRLVVFPYKGDHDGIEQLTVLQHLTMLVASGWDARRRKDWRLLCSSSLRSVSLNSISAELTAGPQVCQVTELNVCDVSDGMPLLPNLSKLAVSGNKPDMGALAQHSAVTEMAFGPSSGVGADELQVLGLLPQLRILTLDMKYSIESAGLALSDAVLQSALNPCTGLECLVLSGLPGLTDQGLEGVVTILPSLHSLEVQGCAAVSPEGRERALRLVARGAAGRGV